MSTERRKLYGVWCAMISRCEHPKNKQYKDYGARGITVCERWHKFENFLSDMWPRPTGMTLERIDNKRGYGPDNCRWATRKEQNSNKRNCFYFVVENGEKVTFKEYCRRNGLNYYAILRRVRDRGWPLDLALHIPVGGSGWGKDAQALLFLWRENQAMRRAISELIDVVDHTQLSQELRDEIKKYTELDRTPDWLDRKVAA